MQAEQPIILELTCTYTCMYFKFRIIIQRILLTCIPSKNIWEKCFSQKHILMTSSGIKLHTPPYALRTKDMALLTQREYNDTTTLLKVLLIIIFAIHLYLHYSWYWQGMVWTLSGVCLLWSTVKMVILKKNVVSPCYWYSSNLSYDWSIQE